MATSITAADDGLFQLSVTSDRTYTATNLNEFISKLTSNGVLTAGEALSTELACAASSGTMNTVITLGNAVVEGHVMLFASGGTVTHPTADVTNPRIDTIVLEKNTDVGTRSDKIKLITGTPAGSPSPTALTQSATVWQKYLYYVTVPANETDADNFTYSDQRSEAASLFLPGDNTIALDKLVALTASRVPVLNGSGEITASSISATILGYLSGLSSNAQAQMTANAAALTALPYCMLALTSATQTGNTVIWNDEISDTSNMHNNSTNPTRITIPSGQGGFYQIDCTIAKYDISTSAAKLFFAVYINGSPSKIGMNIDTSAILASGNFGGCLELGAADYIEIKDNETLSGTKYITSSISSAISIATNISVKRIR